MHALILLRFRPFKGTVLATLQRHIFSLSKKLFRKQKHRGVIIIIIIECLLINHDHILTKVIVDGQSNKILTT